MVVLGCVFALAAVTFLLRRPRHRFFDLEDLASQLLTVNASAFLNLVDHGEEAYLKRHLPPMAFRRIHRERMLAAIQYAWQAAQNARRLMQLAEVAKEDSNHKIAAAGESLYEQALTLRFCSLQMLPRLALSAAWPAQAELPGTFADGYQAMSWRFQTLARLRVPARLSRAA